MALCGHVVHHLQTLGIDLQERHAADVDDVCFSLGAAAVFTGSFVASPPGTTRQQRFALLLVLGGAYAFMIVSSVVQWVLGLIKRGVASTGGGGGGGAGTAQKKRQ